LLSGLHVEDWKLNRSWLWNARPPVFVVIWPNGLLLALIPNVENDSPPRPFRPATVSRSAPAVFKSQCGNASLAHAQNTVNSPTPLYGPKYPKISITRCVLSVANAVICVLLVGTMARLLVIEPSRSFSVETSG